MSSKKESENLVYININCSDSRKVDRHIKNVFKHLYLKKTSQLLNAYYSWYNEASKRNKNDKLALFEAYVRKSIDSTPNKVSRVYGDKYAEILTAFFKYAWEYEDELVDIAKNMVSVVNFDDKKKLGFSKLLSDTDIIMIKDIFKMLKNDSKTVSVLQTRYEKTEKQKAQEKAEALAKAKKAEILRAKSIITISDDEDGEDDEDDSKFVGLGAECLPEFNDDKDNSKFVRAWSRPLPHISDDEDDSNYFYNNDDDVHAFDRDAFKPKDTSDKEDKTKESSALTIQHAAEGENANKKDQIADEEEKVNSSDSNPFHKDLDSAAFSMVNTSEKVGNSSSYSITTELPLTTKEKTVFVNRSERASLTKGELLDSLENVSFQLQTLFLKTQKVLSKGLS